jgi:hypothetical protein
LINVTTGARGGTCCGRKWGVWKTMVSLHKSVGIKADISAYGVKYCW